MNDKDIIELQRRIDQGILLAHARLIERYKHNGWSLVVRQDGIVREIPATEFK